MPARNKKRLVILALVLLAGFCVFIIYDTPPALPAVIIVPPGPFEAKSGRIPDRWIPKKWNWLQRACLSVFGPPRQVSYRVYLKETSETVALIRSQNSLGQPLAESNGLAVWILPNRNLQRQIAASNNTIVNGCNNAEQMETGTGTAIAGDHPFTYIVSFFARFGKGTTDLSTRLSGDFKGKETLFANVRAQLPYGHDLLVLDTQHGSSPTNSLEIIITVDEVDAKGNIVSKKGGGK